MKRPFFFPLPACITIRYKANKVGIEKHQQAVHINPDGTVAYHNPGVTCEILNTTWIFS